jgi:hypothetical protein
MCILQVVGVMHSRSLSLSRSLSRSRSLSLSLALSRSLSQSCILTTQTYHANITPPRVLALSQPESSLKPKP